MLEFGKRGRFSQFRQEPKPQEAKESLAEQLKGWGNAELTEAVAHFENIALMMGTDTHGSDARDLDRALERVNGVLESDRQLKTLFRPPLTLKRMRGSE